jgi:hypothetical protein
MNAESLRLKRERSDGLPGPGGVAARIKGHWLRHWVRSTVSLRALVDGLVPVGYEDETGFHYGAGPTLAICDSGRQSFLSR